MRTLILMRHGETAWNRERRIMGDLDVPLSDAGREQCARVAELLAGFGVDRIVSSPLARALESAGIIAASLGLAVCEDADLREVKFGRWQGKTYDEIVAEPLCRAFLQNPLENETPGGETILDVQRRGLAAIARAEVGECVLFVSHGDILRSAICHYLAAPLAEFRRIRVDTCGLTAVAYASGYAEVKFVNMLADPDRAWDPLHWGRSA